MTGLSRPAMLADRVRCTRCGRFFRIRSAVGFHWYMCQCPRRISVDDLDGIVLGLAYEHRRQLDDREFLTLDDEPTMIHRLVVVVRVGLDWSRPTVDWVSAATHQRPTPRGATDRETALGPGDAD